MRLACSVVLLVGCGYHVYSPPGRVLPLESAATLRAGRTAVGGEISANGGGGIDSIFGATVRVNHGFGERLEGQFEASYASFNGDSAAGTDPNLYQAHAGVKWNPGTKYLGVVAGLGGGASTGGTFTALDAGVIAAWENCSFVPFAGLHGDISVPLEAKDVDVTKTGDMQQHIDRPATTYGFALRAGVKIPIGRDDCTQPERVDLYAGAQILGLYKDTGHDGFLGFSVGARWAF